MKIVYNNWFPFGSYTTINLFGILFTKQKNLQKRVILHESVHSAQMKEMLWLFFYSWYMIEYLLIRLFHKKQGCAYHDVSFEEEAYLGENDSDYLKNRKPYSWWKFVKIRSNHSNK